MKKILTTLCLLSFCMITAFAFRPLPPSEQRAPITISGSLLSLSSLIGEIEKQTDYLFVYSEEDVDIDKMVEVKEGKNSVKDCLSKVLSATGLKYFFENNYIVLTRDFPDITSLQGRIVDSKTKHPLMFASIALVKNGISNVSNGEGFFSLKFPSSMASDSVKFSYLGYETAIFAISDLTDGNGYKTIALKPYSFELSEVVITPKDAASIVMKALDNVPNNYPQKEMQMTGFYREMIKKGNNFVTLTEAALDINKSSYSNSFTMDRASIYKGRGSIDWKKIDTVFIKFSGGINSAFETDLMKDPFLGVYPQDITKYYDFAMEQPVSIDGKTHYVISFKQNENSNDFLFNGKLYIEKNSFAVTRAEFSVNVGERGVQASSLFIKKKPAELKSEMQYASYLVQYKEYQGQWVFDYTRTELKFSAKWKNKLFKDSYTIISEMAITDRSYDLLKIPYDKRIRKNDIVMDKVADFKDEDFWKDYNIIEPESGIDNIISRIIKQLQKKQQKK